MLDHGTGSGLGRLLDAAKHKLHLPGGGDMERGSPGSGGLEPLPSVEEDAAAAEAASYVVGLHQAAQDPGRWYILQGCTGSVRGGQVVGLLGPSGELR